MGDRGGVEKRARGAAVVEGLFRGIGLEESCSLCGILPTPQTAGGAKNGG